MKHHDANRRRFLRLGLTASGLLVIPPVVSACKPEERSRADTKPAEPESGPAPEPSHAHSNKAGKDQVAYQEQPKDGQKCADCVHFQPETGRCSVVDGQISPNGWCTLWAASA